MTAQPRPTPMTADQFLAWAEHAEGRHELWDGEVVAMAPERNVHSLTKTRAASAFLVAVAARGLRCDVHGDGMAIRVDDHTVFEPDAHVRCGPRLPPDDLYVIDPLIVVEVLSPSTARADTGRKLRGYFSLPSLRHYLVLDPDDRSLVHYFRDGPGEGATGFRVLSADSDATLDLDPPGLTLSMADLFEAP